MNVARGESLLFGLVRQAVSNSLQIDRVGLSQPQVSQHLAVLRAVGLVSVRVDGRRRWYQVNGPALQPVFEWVRGFESTWNARLDQLDDVLVELQTKEILT